MSEQLEEIRENNRLLMTKIKETEKLKNDLVTAIAQLKKSQERVTQITDKISELIGIG